MSAGIPLVVRGTDCCQTSCSDQTSNTVPGPQGPPGTNGTNGSNGIDSFTTTTAGFVVPAVNSTVNIPVVTSAWATVNQWVFIGGGAYDYQVTAKPDATHLTVKNLGYANNAAPTTNIANGVQISPGGIKGTDGSAAGITLNSLSPTTTKGDIIVDNGANSPNANDIRVGVGSNGKALVADSAQASGLNYATITPNAATDNAIVRFDGASGTPTPTQNSKMIVTDNGALQSSGTGGNARGTDATDLQVSRAAGQDVASGTNSVICGGISNKASGTYSTVCGGTTNTASGDDAFVGAGSTNIASNTNSTVCGGSANQATGSAASVCAGEGNTASGSDSFVGGGNSNTASNTNDSVCAGVNNTASGGNSSVLGGSANTAAGVNSAVVGGLQGTSTHHGEITHASGQFSTLGDSQTSELLWRIGTTDATANVEMFLDGAALRATIPTNSTWAFHIHLIARSSAGVCAMWETKGALQNNAGTVSLVAAVSQAVVADGTGASWGVTGSFAVTADNTNKALKLAVTGAIGTTIHWTAHSRMVQVIL